MPEIRAKILQISDLHFGTNIDPDVKKQVKNIVEKEQPHILIASGDLVDSPRKKYREQAKAFLDDLCAVVHQKDFACLVVPGNHDYKGLLGSVEIGAKARRVFDQTFLRQEWNNRLLFYERPDLGVVIAGFNSNPPRFEWNAAGKVEAEALQELEKRFPEDDAGGESSHLFRIAVVHHHALPIVFVSTSHQARIEERNMVFYNAGTFLWTLNRKGFHLVLHGHKHFASFQRVGHEFPEGGRRELVVAGAGSALHPKPDDPDGNHLQVVTIYEDGTAALDSWYYSAEVVRKPNASHVYPVLELAEVGKRRERVCLLQNELAVGELRRHVRITKDGYSVFENQLRHCRVPGEAREYFPIELEIPAPAYIRRVEVERIDRTPPLARLVDKTDGPALRKYQGNLEFGRAIQKGDSPFSLAYQYRLMNAHAVSKIEFQRKYWDLAYEFASLPCDQPAGSLTLTVEFPPGYLFDRAGVDAVALYRPGPVSRTPESSYAELIPHPEETERARQGLLIGESTLVLHCCNPIPGYMYQVQWTYPEAATPTTYDWNKVSFFAGKKQRLLEIAKRAAALDFTDGGLYAKVRRVVEGIEAETRKQLQAGGKAIDLCLFAFDEEKKALRVVGANFGKIQDLWQMQFGSGEGCAGFVFEKDRPLYYAPHDQASADLYISPAEQKQVDGNSSFADYQRLTSLPWRHPSGLLVGVISVGSRELPHPDNAMFSPEPEKVEQLFGLLLPRANDILEVV